MNFTELYAVMWEGLNQLRITIIVGVCEHNNEFIQVLKPGRLLKNYVRSNKSGNVTSLD
jgi:hypothetical protein